MLSVAHLSKTYANGVRALDDVTLDVPLGMFGLLGPNGAGKSTLMRTIATLQAPDTGTVRLGDLDVLADPGALRLRLGYLPQEFGTYPRITAREMLLHLAVMKGITSRAERHGQVDALLHQVNLWDVRDQRLDGFSGGMKQRFGIAQALLGNPRLVIVDEPTAGLDPAERRRFHNLLARIGEDVVVILSTHIVEDVADLCPRMAILGNGRILVEGEPAALVAGLAGRVWTVQGDTADTPAAAVLTTRLVAGRPQARVLADEPSEGSEAATPSLEDLYFATLHAHRISGADA